MKFVAFIIPLTIFVTPVAYAQTSSPVNKFVVSFPDRLACDGIEESGLIEKKRVPLDKKVTITISGKESTTPEIEVVAPSASKPLRHFKIGNGYGGDLDQAGTFSYFYGSSEQRLYYLRVLNEGAAVDYRDVLRARSSGSVTYFSARSICVMGLHCIYIANCKVD